MKRFSELVLMIFVCAASVFALPKNVTDTLKMGLVWSDEFNGTKLDTSSWYSDTGPVYNAEQEKYVDSCIEVSNGSLKIWSKSKITVPVRGGVYPSGRIDTHDRKIFTYGYFEAALKCPQGMNGKNGPGLWSACWLLGNSIQHGVAWPTCGEMELYEQRTCSCIVPANAAQPVPAVAGDDEFIACCHYGINGAPSYHSCQHNYPTALTDRYHTYGVLWDTTYVKYYFDDTLFWGPNYPSAQFTTPSITTPDNAVAFRSPFYWIINVAVGGAYQGQNIDASIFPTHMDVDYVRVYQRNAPTIGVKNDFRYHAPKPSSFVLADPSAAQLKVYDLRGKLVADYTSKVRAMQKGENALKALPAVGANAYVVRLFDNGNWQSQKYVATR
ncbi:MAG TPA: glycoside hydrolase family 16 protein [Chitinivibrionales bacterium]|nr:glycoside hydrolase family 16 protein [Chitinivibrionales bacterium]